VEITGTWSTAATAIGITDTVRFVQPFANIDSSTVAADSTTIEASTGADHETTVTVTARDSLNQPIKNATVTLNATGSGNTVSAPAPTNASGEATFTFSSTVAEEKILSAVITTGGGDATVVNTDTVTVVAGPSTADSTAISAADAEVLADGADTTVITVQLRDQFGNARTLGDSTVTLSVTDLDGVGGTWSVTDLTDQSDGTWTATLAASQDSGSVEITGTWSTAATAIGITDTVRFVQQAANADSSTVDVNPDPIDVSNGVTNESTITVTARDDNNRVIKNATVQLESDGTGDAISSATTTNAAGVATFTFSSTVAPEVKNLTITITAGGGPDAVLGTTITVQNP
jgi:hypothetical protein